MTGWTCSGPARVVVVSIGLCLNLATAYCAVAGDGDLLYVVAKGHRSNIERLATWRGTAQVEDSVPGVQGGRSTPVARSSVAFVYSRDMDAKRWVVDVQRDSAMDAVHEKLMADSGMNTTGKELMANRYTRSAILKEGVLHDLGPYTGDARELRILHIRGPGQYRVHNRGWDFDPLYYLTNSGEDLHDRMMFYYKHIEHPKVTGRVLREGDLVTWQSTLGEWTETYTFDLSKGCNLVRYELTTPESMNLWQGEYQMMDGICIPKSVTIRREDRGSSGTAAWQRVVRFEGNVVNEPVAASEFELGAFGLHAGDRLHDHRIDIEYEYRDMGAPEVQGELMIDTPQVSPMAPPEVEGRPAEASAQLPTAPSKAARSARLPTSPFACVVAGGAVAVADAAMVTYLNRAKRRSRR